MLTRPALEIAVASPSGAGAARVGGADRVELCAGLELGGLTPSQALVEQAVDTGIPVHVLIRCRPGGFTYDGDEVALMVREAVTVLDAGARGVVVGALTAEGGLDGEAVSRLVTAARTVREDTEITFHRAVDHATDPVGLVAELAGLGIDRVLSSGGAANAADGAATLARLLDVAGPVQVMAGGGVRIEDLPALAAVGVHAIHLSAKRPVLAHLTGGVPLGVADEQGSAGVSHYTTDQALVATARRALEDWASRSR
ncbi:MAG: copper homeostasis protein CutC [Intrasporangium sp.]|uniref:copper homeostasis protein CutC n=1 Tax=Intrasporangium sp. TaxID=1925024 RepID=UPI0026498D2A|nr:copper homeostasis protein CutC [Intrasporangium sp.]MDN5797380.1 copper homeostasis protein CutC [Intrasporangium sp.]